MSVTANVTALVAAAGGWIVSIVLAVTAYLERRSQRQQERLAQALSKLAGTTSERNIGLALLESWWPNDKKQDAVLVPALVSIAVSLLLDVQAPNNRQEFHNWLRIMALLLNRPYDRKFGTFYDELHHALYVCAEEPGHEGSGIGMTPETARMWLNTIQEKWEIGHVA